MSLIKNNLNIKIYNNSFNILIVYMINKYNYKHNYYKAN